MAAQHKRRAIGAHEPQRLEPREERALNEEQPTHERLDVCLALLRRVESQPFDGHSDVQMR